MTQNIIQQILAATWYPDVCKTPDDYKTLAKALHPDVCADTLGTAAFTHLNSLKTDFENGYVFEDESGTYRSNYLRHQWWGDRDWLGISANNYEWIVKAARENFDSRSFDHFMEYLPAHLGWDDGALTFHTTRKCMPLSKVIGLLPGDTRQKHVNWIYSRMIEFVTMMESIGITHAGLNPASVFVVPETHGIVVASFYHASNATGNLQSINGKYQQFYPPRLFDDKMAGAHVDISLIKKTAICALGDASGSGVKLRADRYVSSNVLNYLMTPESNALASMKTWRDLLSRNFIKEFVPLKC